MYTTKDLAEMFGVSPTAVWYWKKAGIIEPSGRQGKKILLFSEQAVSRILAYDRRKKNRAANRSEKVVGSICWQCIHTYGTACSWTAAKIPVKGWQAEKVFLYGREVSYKVKKCPNFEKELWEEGKDGIKRRVNTVPEMQSGNTVNIMDLYHRSKKFV